MTIGICTISDDFTGGLMVASHIERDGIRCPLIVDPDAIDDIGDSEAAVVASRLRFMPPADAVALMDRLSTRVMQAGTQQLVYKYCATFDSTDHGNIGPCGDLLMRKYGMERMFFAPGFPDLRIFVHEGYMFYKDRIISESIKRFDPITPMNDPDMARVLQRQTKEKVGLLPHRVLVEGPEAAERHVAVEMQAGVRYFMVDSVDNSDMETAARLALGDIVTTGGDAMPIILSRMRRRLGMGASPKAEIIKHAGGRAVVLAGSCGPATLEQLDYFEQSRPLLRLDVQDVAADPEATVRQALAWAEERGADGAVAITTAAGPERVAAIQAAIGQRQAAQIAEETLAAVAAGLHRSGVRCFVIAGGETSGAVVGALRIRRLRASPFDDLGAGSCISDETDPVSLFLKPGKIGTPDVFFRAIARMGGH